MSTVCVPRISRRLRTRSLTAPATNEKSSIGPNWSEPIIPSRRVRQLEHEPGLADALHPGADQRDELAGDEQPEVAVGEGPEAPGDAGHRCTVTLCFCGMFYDVSSVPAPGSPPMGSTVTILFSDIRGFTEYTEQYGDEVAYQVLQEHNEIVRRHIGAFSGKVVKTQGDSFMVAFTTARRAVLCGAAIQREIAEKTQAESGTRIAVGIGINTGEPIYEGGDFFGSTVNLAARVCATAGDRKSVG